MYGGNSGSGSVSDGMGALGTPEWMAPELLDCMGTGALASPRGAGATTAEVAAVRVQIIRHARTHYVCK